MNNEPVLSLTNDPSVPLQQNAFEISFALPPDTPKGVSGSADAVGGCHSRIPSGLAAARTNVTTITAASPSRLDRVLFIVGSSPKAKVHTMAVKNGPKELRIVSRRKQV